MLATALTFPPTLQVIAALQQTFQAVLQTSVHLLVLTVKRRSSAFRGSCLRCCTLRCRHAERGSGLHARSGALRGPHGGRALGGVRRLYGPPSSDPSLCRLPVRFSAATHIRLHVARRRLVVSASLIKLRRACRHEADVCMISAYPCVWCRLLEAPAWQCTGGTSRSLQRQMQCLHSRM